MWKGAYSLLDFFAQSTPTSRSCHSSDQGLSTHYSYSLQRTEQEHIFILIIWAGTVFCTPAWHLVPRGIHLSWLNCQEMPHHCYFPFRHQLLAAEGKYRVTPALPCCLLSAVDDGRSSQPKWQEQDVFWHSTNHPTLPGEG